MAGVGEPSVQWAMLVSSKKLLFKIFTPLYSVFNLSLQVTFWGFMIQSAREIHSPPAL